MLRKDSVVHNFPLPVDPQKITVEVSSVDKHRNERGIGWFVSALFLVGDLAGGGLVALPAAMIQSDFYPGIAITVVMTAIMTYTAHMLGVSWVILQRLWPEYHDHCRNPYPEIGARAIGPTIRTIVSICINITQFGIAVVYLLLSAKTIRDIISALAHVDISYCYVVCLLGIALFPLTLLKSPQDFWVVVLVAMVTTSVAVILIIVGAIIDYPLCAHERGINTKAISTNYFLALGTLFFSYGGHAVFPTIQHDMLKPYHFTRSSSLAFFIVTMMYIPVSVMGYVTYGNSVGPSIINSIQTEGIQTAVNALIAIHCILTLTIVFNPLNQEVEERFNTPHHFCWQRVLVRAATMVAVLFVALSLPNFGPLLDLVGGSTIAATAVVFPAFFYIYLLYIDENLNGNSAMKMQSPPTFIEVVSATPKCRLCICFIIVAIGIVGGAATTFSAIRQLAATQFSPPCYLRPFLYDQQNVQNHVDNINCCGAFQNISISGNSSDCAPYFDYYNQH